MQIGRQPALEAGRQHEASKQAKEGIPAIYQGALLRFGGECDSLQDVVCHARSTVELEETHLFEPRAQRGTLEEG